MVSFKVGSRIGKADADVITRDQCGQRGPGDTAVHTGHTYLY